MKKAVTLPQRSDDWAALVREENTPKGIMAKREELKWLENAKNQLP